MNQFFTFFIITAIIAVLSGHVYAENTTEALDIKLPDAKMGVVFELIKEDPQLTLLSFWRTDCESCLKDLPVLENFSKQHSEWRMFGISLSDKKSSLVLWEQQRMSFPLLINNGFPGALLKRFGSTLDAVPYTVMLKPDRHVCWSAMGGLTAELLQKGLQLCESAGKR